MTSAVLNGYYNFWSVTKPVVVETAKFTELEIALMEGGHNLEETKIELYPFIKMLKNTLP